MENNNSLLKSFIESEEELIKEPNNAPRLPQIPEEKKLKSQSIYNLCLLALFKIYKRPQIPINVEYPKECRMKPLSPGEIKRIRNKEKNVLNTDALTLNIKEKIESMADSNFPNYNMY